MQRQSRFYPEVPAIPVPFLLMGAYWMVWMDYCRLCGVFTQAARPQKLEEPVRILLQ